ncbi:MAG TPA: Holliday junction resolvase RuvX [Bacteroidales bacterium]|nr:Holliday junction resolvase RuvX [Bacteroidales bacterium]HPT01684.1 Holliday junction resolvase RuvX [Bacteroidales bacterium]
MGRVIAIDYGQKRTGLAATDELQMIASPLCTVPTVKVMDFLRDYIQREKVDVLVVGEAVQMNGSPSSSAEFIEPFVRLLSRTFPGIPVERVDERFTSKMASRTILHSGAKKKERQDKGLIDRVSAAIILQSYLERKGMD